MNEPLAGVRVLDATRLLPGNYCAWLLAALGAEVIKIEDPGAGDYMRTFGAQVEGQGATHHLVNRAKRSLVVDLKRPEGVEVLLRLVDDADVFVESFRPGVTERLGIGREVLTQRRPALVGAFKAVVATMGTSGSNSRRCMAWAGVIPPRVLRGRALSSVATSSRRDTPLDAEAGLAANLLDLVVDDADVELQAQAIAHRLTAFDSQAVSLLLDCVEVACDAPLQRGLMAEAALFGLTLTSSTYRERIKAFTASHVGPLTDSDAGQEKVDGCA